MLLLYSLLEGAGLCAPFHLHLKVGVGPVDRVPEQRYQPCSRHHLRHPFCDGWLKQVGGGRLSGYGPLSVLPPRSWEASPIPPGTLLETFWPVEEVQFFKSSRLYERVTR